MVIDFELKRGVDGSRVRDPKKIPVSRLRSIESDRNSMSFTKVVFLASWPWLSTVLQELNKNHRE